jgi:hydroxyacylglutathione hydrolase
MGLEDEIPDVVAKAMMGLAMDAGSLAAKSGIGVSRIEAILHGGPDEDLLRKIAPVLGLDPESLVGLPGYLPEQAEIPGVRRIVLPFGEWTVNAWLIELGGIRLLFDTGCRGDGIITAIGGTMPDVCLITHSHPDHIGGVEALASAGVKVISETEALAAATLAFGPLQLEAVDLSGHCVPATGYFVNGLARQLLIPGDAIFAGSMGGCKTPEAHTLAGRTLRAAFSKAAPGCVILPGHGPATTIAGELASNPFRPRFA